jgi:hypothetical protein
LSVSSTASCRAKDPANPYELVTAADPRRSWICRSSTDPNVCRSTVRWAHARPSRLTKKLHRQIFPDDPDAPATPRTDVDHAVDLSFFFATHPTREPQPARKIDATLNTRLLDLPMSTVPGAGAGALARPVASLAVRNLLRSETLGLPSGPDVARRIGDIPLTDEELGTTGPVYLWYHILKEAEVRTGGRRLGPVGSLIVAEVLIGLLDADPTSYRSAFPAWRPTLARQNGPFEVADLLRSAGVPTATAITRPAIWVTKVQSSGLAGTLIAPVLAGATRSPARSRAVLTSAVMLPVCGVLPRWRRAWGSYSSLRRPTSLRRASSFSNSSRARGW